MTDVEPIAGPEPTHSDIDPGSFRGQVVATARRFKDTWLEMAQLLKRVRQESLFAEWGHKDFDTYCRKELRIRKQTADKLAQTYSFLERHEKAMINAPEKARVPAFEVVEVLAKAEGSGRMTEKDYASIRDEIWKAPEDDTPPKTPAQVTRSINERFPAPAPPPPEKAVALKRFARSARKLAQELSGSQDVPKVVRERAAALAAELEALAPEAAPPAKAPPQAQATA
jgi:hypothetical protein